MSGPFPGLHGYFTGVFQNGIMNFLGAGATRSAQSGIEFMMREELALKDIGKDFAIVNQNIGTPLDDLFKLFASVG
jgi:hypothetical protein